MMNSAPVVITSTREILIILVQSLLCLDSLDKSCSRAATVLLMMKTCCMRARVKNRYICEKRFNITSEEKIKEMLNKMLGVQYKENRNTYKRLQEHTYITIIIDLLFLMSSYATDRSTAIALEFECERRCPLHLRIRTARNAN